MATFVSRTGGGPGSPGWLARAGWVDDSWYTPGAPAYVQTGGRSLEEQTLARRIVEIASDKQASDIVLLDIRPVATVADYFVVMSTASERQMAAVVRDLEDILREEAGIRPLRIEGRAASGWVLIDYGDVIVHVFSAEQRAFYRLEELWATAVPLVRVQ